MAQLKDKDGLSVNPNTTADLVAYDNEMSVKQKIEQIEQSDGASTILENIFNADNIVSGKGVVYMASGAIQSDSQYSCVFVPLEFGKYYCMSGYDFVANGGANGANNIALGKGTTSSFSNLLTTDFVSGASWLDEDITFTHSTNIYKQQVKSSVVFKTPTLAELTDQTTTIGLVINTRFNSVSPINDTVIVAQGIYPVDYVGKIKGKNVAFFGDSITEGTGGGFVGLVAKKAGLNIAYNFGHSGYATFHLASEMLCNDFRYSGNFPYKDYNAYQAVVIQIGTNGGVSGNIDNDIPDIGIYDINSYPYSYSAPTKQITSATLDEPIDFFTKCFYNSFYGNIALCIEYVRYINPNCIIFLTTIPPIENGNHTSVRDALINLARKMGVQVIDAQVNAGLGLWNITYWTIDTTGTRTHLNTKGNEMWACYIANELNRQWYESDIE